MNKPIRQEKLDYLLSKLYSFPVYDLDFSLKCILLGTYQVSQVDDLPDEYRDILVSINLWAQDSAERNLKRLERLKELASENEEMQAILAEIEAEYDVAKIG